MTIGAHKEFFISICRAKRFWVCPQAALMQRRRVVTICARLNPNAAVKCGRVFLESVHRTGSSALTEKGPLVAVCCCGIPAVVVTVRSLGGCHSSAADVPAALAGGVLGLLHKSPSLPCPLYVFRCVFWGVASRALRVVNSPPDSDPWRVGSFVASSPLTVTSGGLSLLAESCILSLRRNIVDIPLL